MPKNNENLNLLFNMLLFKFNKNFIYYLIKNFIYEICYNILLSKIKKCRFH